MAEPTRDRLLRAAVDSLIDQQGYALTTGRLAARAGVVQSAFYNHFASVEECKQVALAEVRQQVIDVAGSFFSELHGPGATTVDDIERMLLDVFGRAQDQSPVFLLFIQRHRSPEVAEAVNSVLQLVRDELAETILRNAPPGSAMTPDLATTASHFSVGVILSGIEHVLDGADPDTVASAGALFLTNGVFSMHTVGPVSPVGPAPVSPAAG